ncbi:CaiB/BaiF CoA transferase family protein [Actinomadura rugatobispora]|uniref:CaiB/BaiF CoA transferase family protein n=1 Tax=Actinomadura rugatobispora TaxID=1994 RepID=A0ABW0ZXS3_9ACTN|nr:CoA transferase [Actinomadura rugatobispora]
MSVPSVGALPLHGVRVLEMADKAEMCGRYLADLGATVIKLEPPGGSSSRRRGPFHDGMSISFAVRNANKQSLTLDLADAGDRGRFEAMLATVDLWIESTAPGSPAAAGLSIAELRARHPRLVVLSVTDFGQTGPYRDWAGSPWVHTAMSGYLSRSRIGDRYPLMPPAALPAEAAAVQASFAALVGLWNAMETGTGDHIDFSLLEATGQILDPAMGMVGTASAGADVGVAATTPARRRPAPDMYPIFECADGFVRVVLLSPRQWRAMRSWLGDPEDLMDDALDAIFTRFARAGEIRRHVSLLFKGRSMAELVQEGQARGVPCAPVLGPEEVVSTGHYLERRAIARHEIATGVEASVPTGFVEFNGCRLGIRTRAPDPGEHNAPLLTELTDARATGAPVATAGAPRRRPLGGIRVLDLGVIVYGAETGRLFADLGADVIKVENRAYPDGARVARGGMMNANFASGHRGKRSIGLNLRSDRGRTLFTALAAESDLVLSNFKPGTLESLGLGYDTLAQVNPGIVMVTSSAMGSTGPWARWMGYGPLVRCASGLSSLWRYPDGPSAFADGNTVYPDHYAARVMAAAGLAALIARRRTGRGAHVEGAQVEAILMQLSEFVALESLRPGAVSAKGNRSDEGAPWGVYPCAGSDEWCVITVRGDEEWARFCQVAGLADLADEPALRTTAGRLRNRERIDARVGLWTSNLEPRAVQHLLQAAGIPAGAMVRATELGDDPHLSARQYLKQLRQPGLGPLIVENAPFFSERIDPPPQVPAPEFGEHTREVLTEVLGLAPGEVQRLIDEGAAEEGTACR